MTALLWMLAWLPQVLPALSKLPQPVNVTLVSRHFIHMLKWEPGPGTPTGVHYHVAVNTYTGTSFVPVVGCERVQHPLICNLTEAFCDPKQVYFTQITALLEGQGSTPLTLRGFKPINDTHLDLPLLTVTPCAEGLCVDLRPPMEHLREVYDLLNYKLRIMSNNADKTQFFMSTKSLSRQILKDLASGRQYCVSVCFSHGLVSRESSYSHAVCASTPGHYTADPWISTALCLLVVLGVVIGALLVYTGFTGLLRRPLPLVLTSIHHLEELLFIPSCNTSLLSSLVNGEPTAPSSGEKRSNQTCDESDGQSETESTGGSRGGAYKMRLGNNLLSSSSSSSSSLSDPLPPEPEPLIPTDTHSNAGLNKSQSTHTDAAPASGSVSGTGGPVPPNTQERKVVQEGGSRDVFHTEEREVVQEGGSRDVFHTEERKVVQEGGSRDVFHTEEREVVQEGGSRDVFHTEERKVVQEGGSRDVFHTEERKVVQEGGSRDVFHTEEREVVQEGGSRDVDLLTLTFGRLGGEEEEEEEEEVGNSRSDFGEMEPESSSASELCNTIPTKEAVIGTVSCSVGEEEEEEHCGYMGRP